jgi:hypothetical protein
LWSLCTKGFPAVLELGLVASATAISHWQNGLVQERSRPITVYRCGAGLGQYGAWPGSEALLTPYKKRRAWSPSCLQSNEHFSCGLPAPVDSRSDLNSASTSVPRNSAVAERSGARMLAPNHGISLRCRNVAVLISSERPFSG